MEAERPSLTAWSTAVQRAVHQVLEGGFVFRDPLAVRILGSDADRIVADAVRDADAKKWLRIFLAVRARFADEALAAAGDASQLVVLGAGLETTAYRGVFAGRIFEVDHPATQAWKRKRLVEAAIPMPGNLAFVPVDFERDELGLCLARGGFDPSRRTFYIWLGVVPYLSEDAVFTTLAFVAGSPGGAHVVFDYGNPPSEVDAAETRAAREDMAARVAAVGEPFRCRFDTVVLHRKLRQLGFRAIEDLGPAGIVARYFPDRPPRAHDTGSHVLHAAT